MPRRSIGFIVKRDMLVMHKRTQDFWMSDSFNRVVRGRGIERDGR